MSGAIAAKAKKVLSNLTVDKARMRENLDLLKGLILSEPVMLVLGEKIGKQTAHEVVYEVVRAKNQFSGAVATRHTSQL